MSRLISLLVTVATGVLVAAPADSQTAQTPDLNGFWTHGFSLGFAAPARGWRWPRSTT